MSEITVSFQVIPICDDPYPVVDKAIEVVQNSGVKHEVGPHETTMEGELDRLLEVVKAGHRACFDAGARRVITFVKIVDVVGGTTIDDKLAKYRQS